MATWPITDNTSLLHDLKNDHHHNLITITHDLQDCLDDSEFNILPFQSHFQQSSTTLSSENDGSNQIDTAANHDKKYNQNTNDQQKQTIQYELMYVFIFYFLI